MKNQHPFLMPRLIAIAAVALAVASSAAAASAEVSFTLDHNLGPGGAWTQAGALDGDLGGALTAARVGRGVVPGLTLTRAGPGLSGAEQAALEDLLARDDLYKVRATADGETTGAVVPSTPLIASAPARCVAARGGDAQLKLDGALTLSVPGDYASPEALQLTGLTFDFTALRCGPPAGERAGSAAPPPPAWAPPPTSPVLLWLPAAAPPVLPAPDPVPGRRGAAAPPPPPTAPVEGDEGEGEDGEKKPPPPDERSWIQKNFVYVLPLTMVIINMMQAAGGGGAEEAGRGRRQQAARAE